MHRGREAIRQYLRRNGIASRYSPKKWKIKVDTPKRVIFIYTMRDAIEHVNKQT